VQKLWSNSDQTVMRQWCNSEAFDCCQGFEMSLIMFYPFVMPWNCVWWHKTFWQKQWWDSDETVMEGFEMSLILLFSFAMQLKCDYASARDTRPFENNSDLTVMRQWCNSDRTVMPLIWRNLCHWSVFNLLQCVGNVIMHLLVTQDHLTKTVIKQWSNSDAYNLSI
jgi:hypothetical protein